MSPHYQSISLVHQIEVHSAKAFNSVHFTGAEEHQQFLNSKGMYGNLADTGRGFAECWLMELVSYMHVLDPHKSINQCNVQSGVGSQM